MHVDPTAGGVLPSWLLAPILAAAGWVCAAPYAVALAASGAERALLGPVPGALALALATLDWWIWRHRGRPWHDWHVIVLLLPAIAAAVWVTVGALVLDVAGTRPDVLASGVGPGIALVGLLVTTISFHGRHHPDERPTGRRGTP